VRNDIILVLVVITALSFDFTNGFHDTGNAMATSIATGALSPRVAVALSGLLNLVGAFLSLAVAATIASGLVNTAVIIVLIILAALVALIYWRSRGSKVDHNNVNAEWGDQACHRRRHRPPRAEGF